MTKNLFRWLKSASATYACFAFINWDYNVTNWGGFTRMLCVLITLGAGMFSTLIAEDI